MQLQLFAAAGLGIPDVERNYRRFRIRQTGSMPLDCLDQTLPHFVIVLRTGGKVRDVVAGFHNSVKSGYNAVLRHPVSAILQIFADHNCHSVIGTDDGIRDIPFLYGEPLFQRLQGGLIPEIAVCDIPF